MKSKTITVIPKRTPSPINAETGVQIKKRVCAYARVSTDLEDQKNSFNAQLLEYETRIKRKPEWEFVRLYSDEGITGTLIRKRSGFREMIKDALNGKIDIILTKSISRFARNTVDCLQTVRDLREKGVIVQFEKEGLTTEDPNLEMILTIFASMAQEESKSISENVKWGIRSRMKRGVVHYYKNILGYDKTEDGSIIVNEEEKKIVLEIYNLYIAGYSMRQICKIMEERNYQTGVGKTTWKVSYISSILQNEKYCGDVLLQKTICKDFLSHRREKNDGCETQFLIHSNHEPIVSREMFDYVQNLKEKRCENYKTQLPANCNPFAGLMICEHCHRIVRMITAHPDTPHSKRYLTCKYISKKKEDYTSCLSSPVDYNLAMNALTAAYQKVMSEQQNIYPRLLESLKIRKADFESYSSELCSLNEELQKYNQELENLITSHIREPNPNYESDYMKIKSKQNEVKERINRFNEKSYKENAELNRLSKIIRYLSEETPISNDIVRLTFPIIIKRKDGSLRFVLSKEKSSFEELKKDLKTILNLNSIFTDEVCASGKSLTYDIVHYGGIQHE